MSASDLLSGVPIWVWIILAVILQRGLSALQDNETNLGSLFILPIIFTAWSLLSLIYSVQFTALAFASMLVALLISIIPGIKLGKLQPPLRPNQDNTAIIKPGSPVLLILVIVIFASKFALLATLGVHPELNSSKNYNIIFGLVNGIILGLAWGCNLHIYLEWQKKCKLAS